MSSLVQILRAARDRVRNLSGASKANIACNRFPTYQEAAAACIDKGYEDEALVEVVSRKTERLRDHLRRQNRSVSDYTTTRTLLGLSLALRNKNGETLRVLDFGGACGAHYFAAAAFFGRQCRFQWQVVETPAMARKAKSVFEDRELRFFDRLDAAKREFPTIDLVYSSGCLQCVPDPYETAKALVDCNARFLFLTRLGVTTEDEDIFATQKSMLSHNGPGPLPEGFTDAEVEYPSTFMRKSALENIIKNKYEIRLEFDEGKMYQVQDRAVGGVGYFAERAQLPS